MSELAERIRELHAKHPTLSLSEIAKLAGCTPAAVTKALDPEKAREWERRSNARRAAAKRAWENDPANRGRCTECGAPRGKGQPRDGLCSQCAITRLGLRRLERRCAIHALWHRGLTLREIAAELDSTTNSIGAEITLMRREGWDMPRRYRWTPEGIEAQRANGRQRKARAAA